MPLNGYVDWCTPNLVAGWAWNSDRPQDRLLIDIFLDDALLCRVPADVYRKDLEDAGIGDGKHGFAYRPASPIVKAREKVSLFVSGTSIALHGSASSNVHAALTPPLPDSIQHAYFPIYGYYVSQEVLPISITANGREIETEIVAHAELAKRFPDSVCNGFYAVYAVGPAEAEVELTVRAGAAEIARQTIPVAEQARIGAAASAAARIANRAFVLRQLICINCSASLAGDQQPQACPACGTQFDCSTQAVSAVPIGSGPVPKAINTSFCAYGSEEVALIETARRTGGVILDFGAGLRPSTDRSVISVEIADMPSIDLVSSSTRIPFADNTFDGAMTLHVLEHVEKPWEVAGELIRVVKPGAPIVCTVPYICAVHGFPNHFYSMTPEGLKGLFRNAEFVAHTLKPDGHPLNGIKQLIENYYHNIPDPALQQKFGGLSMRDIVETSLASLLQSEVAEAYPELAKWEMPAHSTLIVRKR